jgi:hypothetical protein
VSGVLSARERSIFACFADTVLAPAPPLPPIAETDAVAGFEAWLGSGPAANRVGVRVALLALEAGPRLATGRRLRALPPRRRLQVLRGLERIGARPLVEVLRAAAALSYYGDPHVSALLGYDPHRHP